MYVKQISVFIENKQGRLAEFTRALADAGIDLIALSIADTTDFGILRAIASDTDAAFAAVRDAGYAVSLTDVLAVAVPDRPGGLSEALCALTGAGVSVEYLYSLVRNVQGHAVIIFRVSEPERAAQVLRQKNIRMLSQDEATTT